jgi:hypothetical protein
MTNALDGNDARFVAEYLKDKNAVAACERAGISPRKAEQMMANVDIQRAIAAQEAASATENATDEVSLATLIADARRAQGVAEREGNASAMVAATTLIARLTDRLDGNAPELDEKEAEPLDKRDAARAVIEFLRETCLSTGFGFGFCGPGEMLIRVPQGLASAVGGEPAYAAPPDIELPSEPPLTEQRRLAMNVARALGPYAVTVLEAAIASEDSNNG